MRSPDQIDVERIESLLRGVPPESEREAQLEGLIRELRAAAPTAPPLARERVRALRELPRREPFAWKPALVAFALMAALVAGAIAISRAPSGGDDEGEALRGELSTTPTQTAQPFEAYETDRERAAGSALDLAVTPAPESAAGGRAQEWDVVLDLRVPHNDSLSDASADAIRTTRELGGIVVSSSVRTSGPSGDARLVVRVPSRRIQDAIAQLSELGTITGQQVSIQDRQDELDRLARRIDSLRVQIAQLNLRLRTEQLSEPERLELELRRQRLRGEVNSVTSRRGGVSREVALAEIVLTITTGKAAAPPSEGRFEGAARLGWDVLSTSGAVALFLLIVVSPLAVLAAGALLARRRYRRRTEEQILEQPRPADAR